LIFQPKVYLIRRNHLKSLPSRFLVFDTETKTRRDGIFEYHRFRLGWSCLLTRKHKSTAYKEDWKFWLDPRALCDYIVTLTYSKRPLMVFAHNIFFDLQASDFFYNLSLWQWEYDFLYEKESTYILAIHKGDRRIKFISTTNYFQESLEQLAPLVGLRKGEPDFKTARLSELSEYCRNDVEILKRLLLKYLAFVRENDLGRFALTKSSQAMNAFRHRFMRVKIFRHEDDEIVNLERDAYFGGRVECRFLGEVKGGPFVSLDINSMYPFIMKNFTSPVKLVDYRWRPTKSRLENFLDEFAVVARVRLNTDQPLYAYRKNFKVYFPIGEFETCLCTNALKAAILRGHLVEVIEVAFYQKAFLFSDYVDFFYNLRLEYKKRGNLAFEQFCKYALNCLYGKWAQKREIVAIDRKVDAPHYRKETIVDMVNLTEGHITELLNTRIESLGIVEGKNTLVPISAHITENARLLLWEIIEGLGYENLIYCDTDSIKIRERDFHRVKWKRSPTELGSLKLEERFSDFHLLGAKNYITERKRKIKGIPKKAEQLDDFTYKYQSFLRQQSHLRAQKTRFYITRDVVKDVSPQYDKGLVHPTGEITPYVLGL
jgi:hypothetical protein